MEAIPDIRITTIDRMWSDHNPILLHVKKSDFGPTPFKFYNSWLTRDGFDDLIKSKWATLDTSNGGRFLKSHEKLRGLKTAIKQWHVDVRNNDRSQKQVTLSEIKDIEKKIDDDILIGISWIFIMSSHEETIPHNQDVNMLCVEFATHLTTNSETNLDSHTTDVRVDVEQKAGATTAQMDRIWVDLVRKEIKLLLDIVDAAEYRIESDSTTVEDLMKLVLQKMKDTANWMEQLEPLFTQ
ncbi:Mediator of RNA polymerase II transcription subunit 13 like [Artemisia annua]|uniref:Mediator of RNA polymerase II transcription subunit 13 like n=1 Tax=Artemisia annua TaxID=35608 RepID=A0A2U1KSJ5_ARTAN|nr:Mediator of RNA polymerase II transcription subunit 13 like [Artemisia annua]